MADILSSPQALNAIPVVVGGLIAIAGGLGSQYAIHLFTDSRDKKKLRRDRIEELVRALYAHEQWITDKKNRLLFRNEDHTEPAPLNAIRMFQALHFPELAKEVNDVQQACLPMLKFIGDQRLARMTDEKSFIANWDPARFDLAYKQHLLAAKALTDKCRDLMK